MGTYDHTAFQVSDMATAIAFYVDKLGFALSFRATNVEEGEEYAFLTLGDLRLELIQDLKLVDYRKPEIRPPYCPHLAIETRDMQGAVAQLQRNAGPTGSPCSLRQSGPMPIRESHYNCVVACCVPKGS